MRWFGLTKYLGRLGWTSAILTAAQGCAGGRATGAAVERCPRLPTLVDGARLIRRLVRQRALGRRSSSEADRPGAANHTGVLQQLGRELTACFEFPDDGRGWILRAALRARALIAGFRPDAVVSSGPPHSAHLVAGLALAGSEARWLIDLRDPWAGPFPAIWQSHRLLGSRTYRVLSRRLEAFAVRAADGVMTTTRQLAEVLNAQYPSATVTWVPNGVDEEGLPAPPPDRYSGLGIAYAGTLYAGRDIGAVARALRLFLDRHPEAVRAGSKLRVAGHADSQHARAFFDALAAAGVEQAAELLGLLPRQEALRVLQRSRLSLVLAQHQELQIPAKLYESIALGVPTLVVAPGGSATALEGRRVGAIVHEPDDVEGIAGLLERLWHDGAPQRPRCPSAITYDALATTVDVLLRAPRVARVRAAESVHA